MPGRDGCRVPLPWTSTGSSFGFSTGGPDGGHAAPWLPQPGYWGQYSVAEQIGDPGSFLNLYRAALTLRRTHPALGLGAPEAGTPLMRWLDSAPGTLAFTREPGFTRTERYSIAFRARDWVFIVVFWAVTAVVVAS